MTTDEDKEESPVVRHASVRISVEGSSPNEPGDVTLEISARRGGMIGVVAKQGEDEEEQAIEMLLSHGDFLHFLTLAQVLLSIAVEDAVTDE